MPSRDQFHDSERASNKRNLCVLLRTGYQTSKKHDPQIPNSSRELVSCLPPLSAASSLKQDWEDNVADVVVRAHKQPGPAPYFIIGVQLWRKNRSERFVGEVA